MKKRILFAISLLFIVSTGFYVFSENTTGKQFLTAKKSKAFDVLQEGDIIFQSSMSGQSHAIQLATRSKYSHCGVIFKEGNEYFVYEAVQPVKKTPLAKWITHGDDNHYVVKRLKEHEKHLTKESLKKLKKEIQAFMGKDYDLTFEWDDQRIYCSELVWKGYERATGLEVGKLQELKEFDLTHPIVKQKLKERYGKNIPMNETVISPGAIFESELLELVVEK